MLKILVFIVLQGYAGAEVPETLVARQILVGIAIRSYGEKRAENSADEP
jgi:hypothetical protein